MAALLPTLVPRVAAARTRPSLATFLGSTASPSRRGQGPSSPTPSSTWHRAAFYLLRFKMQLQHAVALFHMVTRCAGLRRVSPRTFARPHMPRVPTPDTPHTVVPAQKTRRPPTHLFTGSFLMSQIFARALERIEHAYTLFLCTIGHAGVPPTQRTCRLSQTAAACSPALHTTQQLFCAPVHTPPVPMLSEPTRPPTPSATPTAHPATQTIHVLARCARETLHNLLEICNLLYDCNVRGVLRSTIDLLAIY